MMQVRDLELSGSDYFLFAMDRIMCNAGCADSPCRLVVNVEGQLDPEELQETLNRSPLLQWMANVRKTRNLPFTIPRWQSNGSGKTIHVARDAGQWSSIGENSRMLSYHRSGLDSRAFLSFTLSNNGNNGETTCLLNWDHTLMDAHGAEVLFQHLAGSPEQNDLERMLPEQGQLMDSRIDSSEKFFRRLTYARKSVHYISKTSAMPIATLNDSRHAGKNSDEYFLVNFTGQETERIKERCSSSGMGFYHSIVFLAAALRALHAVRLARGEEPVPYLVPVPLNLRKKGGVGPAFSNNVSFLFYRVVPEELEDFSITVETLKNQMRQQLAEEIPYSYLEMMKILRRLPLPFYSRLLSGPTRGQFASFFFSFTGDCCPEMDTFMGKPVEEIVHLAPATSIPGLSIVFMRHRDSLKTILSFRDSLLDRSELTLFEQRLRTDLLSGEL